ncbi:MAG: hemolysin III family protein [Firmicutes bacterium]|nr:hemolysin III family protein [Bacillota bacterium]
MKSSREPASALTHLIGALLSIGGLVALIYKGAVYGTAWHVVSFTVFGVSLILLYTASTLYHGLALSARARLALRKLDHMMIFLLIAGTYTPFCLVPLRGAWGWPLFGVVWGCAALGMIVKLFWMNVPRWLSTGFYLLMGWLVLVAAYPLSRAVTTASLAWLVAGGLLYTIGAVFYAAKWPSPWPGRFGFHEIWHLFVMAGSSAHFVAVLALV